jgi:hypothetical protein
MRVMVEILHWDGGEQPKVLHALCHESHSLETVKATAQGLIDSPDVPANGYRITTDEGLELFGCPQTREEKLYRNGLVEAKGPGAWDSTLIATICR